jgi:predicted GIY-YIG superfamily endonuclease
MPKSKMSYNDMVIYKICCKDLNITDIYVGHTCNLSKRRWHHKNCCENETGKYNMKVYQFIRENGGWNNWSMIMIEQISCDNFNEACKLERKFLEEFNGTLNMLIPSIMTRNLKSIH